MLRDWDEDLRKVWAECEQLRRDNKQLQYQQGESGRRDKGSVEQEVRDTGKRTREPLKPGDFSLNSLKYHECHVQFTQTRAAQATQQTRCFRSVEGMTAVSVVLLLTTVSRGTTS